MEIKAVRFLKNYFEELKSVFEFIVFECLRVHLIYTIQDLPKALGEHVQTGTEHC